MNALNTNYTQVLQNEGSEVVKNLKTKQSIAVGTLSELAFEIDYKGLSDLRTIADRIYAICEALR